MSDMNRYTNSKANLAKAESYLITKKTIYKDIINFTQKQTNEQG